MNRFFASHRTAGNFNCTVADDLVGIHVGLGARTGLPNHKREMGVEFSRDDLVGGLNDQIASFLVQKLDSTSPWLRFFTGMDDGALDRLEQGGWTVRRWSELNLFFGGVQAVARHPDTGRLTGGGDPRRGGVATVVE